MAADQLMWLKSRRSISTGACVELASDGECIALRNTREPNVILRFTRAEMSAFLTGAALGEFDHLVE